MEILSRECALRGVVTSTEVIEILGISRARLSQLVKKDKLAPLKKNLFLLDDVLKRKIEQNELRQLYYRPRSDRCNETV